MQWKIHVANFFQFIRPMINKKMNIKVTKSHINPLKKIIITILLLERDMFFNQH
jgi:hypothetical protein